MKAPEDNYYQHQHITTRIPMPTLADLDRLAAYFGTDRTGFINMKLAEMVSLPENRAIIELMKNKSTAK